MPKGCVVSFPPDEFVDTTGARVVRLTPPDAPCTRNYFYQKAFTRDGKLLFGCALDGRMNLWLLDLAAAQATQLTEGEGDNVQGCTLSPDDRFAYFSRAGSDFVRLDLSSREETVVYTSPQGWRSYGTWSLDDTGTKAAAIEIWADDQVTGDGWKRFTRQFHRRPRQRLLAIDLTSGAAQVVLDQRGFIGHPMFRPGDNGLMAFCHEGPHDLVDARMWVVNRDGSGLKRVREPKKGEACMHEFWVPDGSRLVYVSYSQGQALRSIWAYDPDTDSNQELLSMPPCAHLMSNRRGTLFVGNEQQLGDVADVEAHAFVADPHLYLFDTAAGFHRVLCRHDSSWAVYQGNTQVNHPHPSFTPDENHVLFASDRSGVPGLYLVEVPARDGLTTDLLPQWQAEAVADLAFPLGWKGREVPEVWRQKGRDAFHRLLLEPQAPDAAPLVVHSEERDDYRVEVVELSLGRGRRTLVRLGIPRGSGPFPAALVLHDHGAEFTLGCEKVFRPRDGHPRMRQAQAWVNKYYGGRFWAEDLVKSGWVVLAHDALGWGERACAGYESQQALASNLFNLGSSWAGVIAVEDAAAARFLASHAAVDPRRVASLGHSLGGYRSYQLAAWCDAITASAAVCCLGTLTSLMVTGGNRVRGQSAFASTHPGMAALFDFPDLAALAAPKPLLFVHGTDDRLFPEHGARKACEHVAQVYQAFGAAQRFRAEFRPGGHEVTLADQALIRGWLDSAFDAV